jgi:hypothetical protein
MKNKKPVEIDFFDQQTDGYPVYPPREDIYSQSQEAYDIDPEDPLRSKTPNETDDGDDDLSDDLDVPNAEADDEQENIGSEDEENNYYSIGGDRHDDLEDDN